MEAVILRMMQVLNNLNQLVPRIKGVPNCMVSSHKSIFDNIGQHECREGLTVACFIISAFMLTQTIQHCIGIGAVK